MGCSTSMMWWSWRSRIDTLPRGNFNPGTSSSNAPVAAQSSPSVKPHSSSPSTIHTYFSSNFTTTIRIRDRSLFDPGYVALYLHALYLDEATETLQRATTGIRNLDWREYLRIEVPAHPLQEQQSLARLIIGVRTAYRHEQHLCQTLMALKRSALSSIFTRGLHGEAQKDTEIGADAGKLRVRTHRGTLLGCIWWHPISWRPCLLDWRQHPLDQNYRGGVLSDYGDKGAHHTQRTSRPCGQVATEGNPFDGYVRPRRYSRQSRDSWYRSRMQSGMRGYGSDQQPSSYTIPLSLSYLTWRYEDIRSLRPRRAATEPQFGDGS